MAAPRSISGGLFAGVAATLLTLAGTMCGAIAGGFAQSAIGPMIRLSTVDHPFVDLAERGVGVMAGAYLGTIAGLIAAIGFLFSASVASGIFGLLKWPLRSS